MTNLSGLKFKKQIQAAFSSSFFYTVFVAIFLKFVFNRKGMIFKMAINTIFEHQSKLL